MVFVIALRHLLMTDVLFCDGVFEFLMLELAKYMKEALIEELSFFVL